MDVRNWLYLLMNWTAALSTFSNIEINRTEIDQSLLDIDQRSRTSMFAWNGQFSPQFIEALLDRYAFDGCVVYDPFVGSGTVLSECASKQLGAIGIELNPAAYFMAKINEFSSLSHRERCQLLDSTWAKVSKFLYSNTLETDVGALLAHSNGQEKTLISLLVVLCDFYNNQYAVDLIYNKWEQLSDKVVDLPYSEAAISVFNIDSRYANCLESNSADLVITSPPYINVMNYHQQYRRSVECLGYDVLSVAKHELGSNRANRGNRFYTVIQYCIDMALSIKEMARVLKPKARLIIVVGKESTVLKARFCNSELIFRICTEVFGMPFLLRQQRVFKNKFGKMIYEDILHFENANLAQVEEEELEDKARAIAVDALREALVKSTNNDQFKESSLLLLQTAISRAPFITRS